MLINKNKSIIGPLLIVNIGYIAACNYLSLGFQRGEPNLQLGYFVFFITYIFSLLIYKQPFQKKGLLLFICGLLVRLLFLGKSPYLSDDYYRFIWDGAIWWEGYSPYLDTPTALMAHLDHEKFNVLYDALNSQQYRSVYPPFYQWVFRLITFLGGSHITKGLWSMQLLFLIIEVVTFGLLFTRNKRHLHLIAVYWLNPLVILEGIGNLHIEILFINFGVLVVYWLHQKRWIITAVPLALAFATKLSPLIYTPLLVLQLSWKKKLIWIAVFVGVVITVSIGESLSLMYAAIFESTSLFVKHFEFNGGLYFLVRGIGFWIKGWNVIDLIWPYFTSLMLLGFGIFTFISWRVALDQFLYFGGMVTIYLLFSTTVHPWYILPLIGFLGLRGYIFPIIWSMCIFWTYLGYIDEGYEHPYLFISLEYLLVFIGIAWDLFHKSSKTPDIIT